MRQGLVVGTQRKRSTKQVLVVLGDTEQNGESFFIQLAIVPFRCTKCSRHATDRPFATIVVAVCEHGTHPVRATVH